MALPAELAACRCASTWVAGGRLVGGGDGGGPFQPRGADGQGAALCAREAGASAQLRRSPSPAPQRFRVSRVAVRHAGTACALSCRRAEGSGQRGVSLGQPAWRRCGNRCATARPWHFWIETRGKSGCRMKNFAHDRMFRVGFMVSMVRCEAWQEVRRACPVIVGCVLCGPDRLRPEFRILRNE